MQISSFDDLLAAARSQEDPQRLLFVFTAADLNDDSSEAQRRSFEAGEGGTLTPVMMADKTPQELADFATLLRESEQFDKPWAVLFVAALGGRDGAPAPDAEVERAFDRMTDAIRQGRLSAFLAFDRAGDPLILT